MRKILIKPISLVLSLSMVLPLLGISVNASASENSIAVNQIDGEYGNYFFDDEVAEIKVSFKNGYEKSTKITVNYSVVDYFGDVKVNGSLNPITLSVGGEYIHTFRFENLPFHTYKLKLDIYNHNYKSNSESEIEFSKIVSCRDADVDWIGQCVHFNQGKGGEPNINLSTLDIIGNTWVRDDFSWEEIEEEPGVYDFSEEDIVIDKMLAHNQKPLICISYGSPFYDNYDAPHTDEGRAAFARMCAEVVKHYKGKVSHFEIWNEYNGGMGNANRRPPETYAEMLKVAYIAMKEADPDVTVVGCATSLVAQGWIERVIKHVGIEYMDGVSVHPYGFPNSPESAGLEASLMTLHEMLQKYGKDMPVWSSEYGYPTYVDSVTDDYGAAYLQRGFIIQDYIRLATGQNDIMMNYDFQNDFIDPERRDREANFGIIKHESENYAAKQGLLSMSSLQNLIAKRKIEGRYEPNGNIVAYKYTGDNQKDMIVLWTLEYSENCSLKVSTPTVTLIDYLGNRKEVTAHNGYVNIGASLYPTFVEGEFKTVEFDSPRFYPNDTVTASQGEVFDVILKRNAQDTDKEMTVKSYLPVGLTAVSDAVFKQGETETAVSIKTVSDIAVGKYSLKFYLADSGNVYGECGAEVNIVADRNIIVKPVITDTENWKEWAIDIKVKCNSKVKKLGGKVSVLAPVEYKDNDNMEFEPLGYGEEASFRIPVLKEPGNYLTEFIIKTEFDDGKIVETSRIASALASVRTTKPIVIDGMLSEKDWTDAMWFDMDKNLLTSYDGPADLSGRGAMMWDKNYVYIGVELLDDIHFQNQLGDGMWTEDGLQFVIDQGRERGYGTEGWHEIGFGLSNDGKSYAHRWQAIPGKSGGEMVNVNLQAKRDEVKKTTVYEASIPWTDLLPAGATMVEGDIYGFSILANESDGAGRLNWIEYMSGIGGIKNAREYGDVIMLDLTGGNAVDGEVAEEDKKPEPYEWAKPFVESLNSEGVTGYSAENYPYGNEITYGEFVKMLIKSMNFADVNEAWNIARELNIVADGKRPEDVIIRQNLMTLVSRALKVKNGGEDADLSIIDKFSDSTEIADYARQSVANLVEAGIISGSSDGKLYPNSNATYAEAAVILSGI